MIYVSNKDDESRGDQRIGLGQNIIGKKEGMKGSY